MGLVYTTQILHVPAAGTQSWSTCARTHAHTLLFTLPQNLYSYFTQQMDLCLFYPSSVIRCLSLGESSMLGPDWSEASIPCGLLMLLRWGPPLHTVPAKSGLPLLGPDHKSQPFIFTAHCTQTHICLPSHIICMPFLTSSHTQMRTDRNMRAVRLYQRASVLCLCINMAQRQQ